MRAFLVSGFSNFGVFFFRVEKTGLKLKEDFTKDDFRRILKISRAQVNSSQKLDGLKISIILGKKFSGDNYAGGVWT